MKKIIGLLLLILIVGACEFKEVEFLGIENVAIDKMEDRELILNLAFKLKNENGFKLKIKPSKLRVFVEDKDMGLINLDEKLVFKKRSESTYTTKLKIDLAEGYLLKLISIASKKEFKIRLEGKVKAGVFGISKKFPVNETRTFSREQLKLDQLMR